MFKGMQFSSVPGLFSTAGKNFMEDRALSLAASLSFYTLLSFAPLMVLVVWAASSLGTAEQEGVLRQIGQFAGTGAQEAARAVLTNAQTEPSVGSIAGLGGIAMSLFFATTVFAQLQGALNEIWGIRTKPGRVMGQWIRRRLMSIGIVAAVGFVLVASLIVSALIGLLLEKSGLTWRLVNNAITLTIFVALFSFMFRYLPDARLPHRYAWQGGAVTAILFTVGKALIGAYLSRDGVGSPYGAAAFLVILMLWVYYASAILFFGAEFVQALIRAEGHKIPLTEHALRVSQTNDRSDDSVESAT